MKYRGFHSNNNGHKRLSHKNLHQRSLPSSGDCRRQSWHPPSTPIAVFSHHSAVSSCYFNACLKFGAIESCFITPNFVCKCNLWQPHLAVVPFFRVEHVVALVRKHGPLRWFIKRPWTCGERCFPLQGKSPCGLYEKQWMAQVQNRPEIDHILILPQLLCNVCSIGHIGTLSRSIFLGLTPLSHNQACTCEHGQYLNTRLRCSLSHMRRMKCPTF